ncbi:MAG: hypothetical protein RXR31_07380 [Thermoproteota archaeon]
MLDINLIRKNPQLIEESLKRRNLDFPLKELIDNDNLYRKKLKELESKRHEKNILTEQ